jgi:PAS domain S-box-containing protein
MTELSLDDHVRVRAFDEITEAILVADDERRIVDVNDAACALFERSRAEMLTLRIHDLMPATPDTDVDALWLGFLADGAQAGTFPIARSRDTRVVEYRARARIAPHRHISILRDTARVLPWSPSLTTAPLRTDTRAAEQAGAILEAVLAAAPVGFAFLDRELRFRMINEALASMNGLPIEAHIGHTPMEILPGLAADFIRTQAEAVFASGRPQVDLELKGETPARPGVERTWVEHWYPVRVDGEIVGVGILVEEVTDKRHAERQLREAAELRDRLMAIVSHDLRNPLSGISTAASMIATSEAPKSVIALAQRVSKMTTRMSALIEQLLDFVRVDQAGGLVLERSAMDLAKAASRAADESSLAFPDAQISVSAVGVSAGSWDEDRILQVLTNLTGNAVQHGDGRVTVRVDGRDPSSVRLEVENAGKAIPTEMLEVIFDPFRRAAHGYARRTGLGLGLFISKSVVEAHGGSISVRSKDGETVFSIELPRN